MPEAKVFLETNIIMYANDVSAKEKHEQRWRLVTSL